MGIKVRSPGFEKRARVMQALTGSSVGCREMGVSSVESSGLAGNAVKTRTNLPMKSGFVKGDFFFFFFFFCNKDSGTGSCFVRSPSEFG